MYVAPLGIKPLNVVGRIETTDSKFNFSGVKIRRGPRLSEADLRFLSKNTTDSPIEIRLDSRKLNCMRRMFYKSATGGINLKRLFGSSIIWLHEENNHMKYTEFDYSGRKSFEIVMPERDMRALFIAAGRICGRKILYQ